MVYAILYLITALIHFVIFDSIIVLLNFIRPTIPNKSRSKIDNASIHFLKYKKYSLLWPMVAFIIIKDSVKSNEK